MGVSIKPKTRVEEIFPYLDDLDLVLVMTVEPGFGGQEFLFSMVEKIKRLKEEIVSRKLPVLIEVDGGINSSTAKIAKEAGVDICVAGTSIFSYKNYTKSIKLLKFKGE